MKRWNKIVGQTGEAEAERLLARKGYDIISRNFSTRYGEIDLICRDGETLVFVEVKTKKGPDFGTPEDMFTRRKLDRVKRMAIVYLEGKETKCRIDMVAVVLGQNEQMESIQHYQNVDQIRG
jgi:putative endonuclease